MGVKLSSGRWAERLAQLGGRAGILVLSLLVTEGALRVGVARSSALKRLLTPDWGVPVTVVDSTLGVRGNPAWYDHDAQGFRNRNLPRQADVVPLGDSQTYGVGVERAAAWPDVLARVSGHSVYQMALPGWGPGQGYLILGRALALRPRLVVYAFYFGNDFFDVFQLLARPELRGMVSPSLLDSANALETRAPIGQRVHFLFERGDTAHSGQPGTAPTPRNYLARHSRLYGLARALRAALSGPGANEPALLSRSMTRALAAMNASQRQFVLEYHAGGWQTLLTPSYRNAVIDDHDPRIRAGLEGTEQLLAALDSLCRREGVRFLVVLIPTKETVFARRGGEWPRATALDSLVRNEERAHDLLTAWLLGHHECYLDVEPVLEASDAQPYFEDGDGHPNATGHRLIATALAQWMMGSPHPSGESLC